MPSTARRKAPSRVPRPTAKRAAKATATVINVHAAKTQLSRLLARVAAGEEITIARAGQPLARLVPLAPATARGPRVPGRFKGLVGPPPDALFFDPLPADELARRESTLPHPSDPLSPPP
jgi:prevent-host-death family protein